MNSCVIQWESQGVHPDTVKVVGGRNMKSHGQILRIQSLQKMKDVAVNISHQRAHIPRRGRSTILSTDLVQNPNRSTGEEGQAHQNLNLLHQNQIQVAQQVVIPQ